MLELIGLQKRFGKTTVLKGVDLKVERGETVVLMGPSGCGKSTTIRCANLLVYPDSGQVIFKGRDLCRVPRQELNLYRQDMGFVFQQFNLIKRLSARENVMIVLMQKGMSRADSYKLAEGALQEMGLYHGLDLRPDQLSGGEQQRVALARALVLEPDLILLDEPTASLDPILVKEVLDSIEKLARRKGRAIFLVTHEVALAKRIADRVVLMDRGEIVEAGPPEKIFTQPDSWVGRRYKEIIAYH